MNLQQLEYFLVSARRGSLTKAAEELYTTQPHVSQVIASLERELNVKLFFRTASGIALTRQGEDIRFYAENTLKNAALIRELSAENSENTIRIAANASSRLAFMGGEYFLKHAKEGLALSYTECGTEEMLDLIMNCNYDLGFLFVPVNKMTAFEHRIRRRYMEYTPLLSSDLVVHSGPRSPFFERTVIEPEELNECECIQLEDDFFSVEELLMSHKGFHDGRYRIRKMVRTNSDHLMIRMLQQTGLCNIGSYWYGLKGEIEDYNFSISVINGFQNQVSFGYLAPSGRKMRPEAEEFIEMLRKTLI